MKAVTCLSRFVILFLVTVAGFCIKGKCLVYVSMIQDMLYRIRVPPGSCLRQLTIPTMPQLAFEAVSHTGQSDDSAIMTCRTDTHSYLQ